MQRRFLFVALVFVLGFGGVWIHLANKFEKLVESDVRPFLDRNKEILSVNELKVDKYKFKLNFNGVKISNNTDNINIALERIDASYNPFKDSINLKPVGEKIQLRILDKDSYIKDPKVSIFVERSILEKDLSDRKFGIALKFDDLKLFSSNDELIYESKEIDYKLSHSKNGDNHDIEVSINSNGSLIYKLDSSFTFEISSKILSPKMFEDMEKNFINLSNGLSKYPFSEKIKISVSDALFEKLLEGSTNPQKVTSKLGEFAIGINLKFGPTGVLDLDFKTNSSNSQFDLVINKNGEFFPEETYPYLAGYLLSFIDTIVSEQGLTIKQDAITSYLKKNYSEVNKWSVKLNFSENFSHDIVVTHNDKAFKAKGNINDEDQTFNEKVEFDNILGYIAYKKSLVNEAIDMFVPVSDKPEEIAKTQGSISESKKLVKDIYYAFSELVKLLHKGDKPLAEGDKFELDLALSSNLSPLFINGKKIDEYYPKILLIMGSVMDAKEVNTNQDHTNSGQTGATNVDNSSSDNSAKSDDQGSVKSDPYLEEAK